MTSFPYKCPFKCLIFSQKILVNQSEMGGKKRIVSRKFQKRIRSDFLVKIIQNGAISLENVSIATTHVCVYEITF